MVSGAFVPTFPSAITGPGRLLYVEGTQPERLHVTLRVRDVSRAQESLGTELPVVWEDQGYGPRSFFAIQDIPRGPQYRSKLRVYRVDTAETATVNVRVSNDLNAPSMEQPLTLSAVGRQASSCSRRTRSSISIRCSPWKAAVTW